MIGLYVGLYLIIGCIFAYIACRVLFLNDFGDLAETMCISFMLFWPVAALLFGLVLLSIYITELSRAKAHIKMEDEIKNENIDT